MRNISSERIREYHSTIGIRNQYYLHYRKLQNDIIDYIGRYFKGGKVLDLGAGNQPYRKLFNKAQQYVSVDIDISNKALDVIADNTILPFRGECFDLILCTQVIEHVNEPLKLFKEANRIMKSDARLILTCPMSWELHEKPYDYFRYTIYGIQYLAKEAGFEVVESTEQGGAFAVAGQTIINNKKIPLKKIIIPIINILFSYLDDKYYDPDNTINYIFALKKLHRASGV